MIVVQEEVVVSGASELSHVMVTVQGQGEGLAWEVLLGY